MRITNTGKSIKISLASDELKFIVDKLGFNSITDMISNGIEDMLVFIAQQVRSEQGIDLTDMIGDVASVSIMVINDIMLIEIPKDDEEWSNVMDRPQERFREFMEHLRDAIIYELEKQRNNLTGDSDKTFVLYKMPSVGRALSALEYVKDGDIIRWKGDIYIRSAEVSPGLLEHFEPVICPAGLQPDDIIFSKN